MQRDSSIDQLRSGVTLLVVAHHAALAYTTFSNYYPDRYTASTAPVVDGVRSHPLDFLVAWNDLYFMALMFLISGLFVAPSLSRKGAGAFFTERFKRLGMPFVLVSLVLSPLAYYPSWKLSAFAGDGGFLGRFFTQDGWPGGPAWFIWVLLAFSTGAALLHRYVPGAFRRLGWTSGSSGGLVLGVVAATVLATLPVRLFVEPYAWTSLGGPFAFQTSRILLYAAWFLLGVAIGAKGLDVSLTPARLKPWPIWLALGLVFFIAHYHGAGTFQTPQAPAWAHSAMFSLCYALSCAFTGLGLLGMARRVLRRPLPGSQSLSANAFGVYLFHYAFLTWIQYALLTQALPAGLKFLVCFAFALGGSWLLTALLRRTPARNFL